MLIYYQNVNGLLSKLSQLYLSSFSFNYEILCLTETNLNENIKNEMILCKNYNIFRCDRSIKTSEKLSGGGCLIAIISTIESEEVAINDDSLEFICVKIRLANKKYLFICCIYIAPGLSLDIYLKYVNCISYVINLMNRNDNIIILGDFNLPKVNWINNGFLNFIPIASCNKGRQFLENILNFGLFQFNYLKNSVNNVLDLVFCDDEFALNLSASEILVKPLDIFHPPLKIQYNTTYSNENYTNYKYFRDFRKTDFNLVNNLICNFDWTYFFNLTNVNVACAYFYKVMNSFIIKAVPLKKIILNDYSNVPWETKFVRRLKNKKNNLYKKFKRNYNKNNYYNQYLKAKEKYLKFLQISHGNYMKKIKDNIRIDSRNFWNYVNNKRKSNNLPKSMFLDNNKSSNSIEKCNLFANFFDSVYDHENKDLDCDINCDIFDFDVHFCNIIDIPNISVNDVFVGLQNLKVSCNSGPDGLPSILFKNCCNSLCTIVHHLFLLSFNSCEFPELWKSSFLFPLFKNGNKNNVKNYRGISKLSCLPKLFESICMPNFSRKLRSIISDCQHGFLRGKSIDTNLIEHVTRIFEGFKSNKQVDVIYTDFSKAFDKVNHSILLKRLLNYGVSVKLVCWFRSYLLNRSQFVKLDSSISRKIVVPSGVPQGSHFGPFLFLIFIDPISKLFKNCSCNLYADDAKLLMPICSKEDCYIFQNDINQMVNWCKNNRLNLNINKCNVISFCRKPIVNFDYKLNGNSIERVDSILDLGVILDNKLSFQFHIDNIVNKAVQRLGLIKRFAIEFCDIFITKCLHVGLVRPLLETSSLIWSSLLVSNVNRIESVQKQFLLFVLRNLNWSNRFNLPPYTSRLNLIDLDTLENRRRLLNAMWILKILTGVVDCPFVLRKLSIIVPRKRLRNHQFIQPNFDRRVFIFNQPLNNVINDFNLVYAVIDFNLSLDLNKKKIRDFLRNMYVTVPT